MGAKRVLIADDDSAIRAAIRRALHAEGYLVEETADGQETLAAIDRCKTDVLLLDLKMPVLDGMGVLRELARAPSQKKPRIIILSGHGTIPIAVKATRLGAMAFLEKPVTIAEVSKAILEVLAEPLPAASAPSHDSGVLAGGYPAVLDRIREALRQANYPLAETLLMRVDQLGHTDAAYFNLLGIYHESNRQWRLARRFFAKAVSANAAYKPARLNMRRLNDLTTRGHTRKPLVYGDETEVLPDDAQSPQSNDLPPAISPR